MTPIVEKYREYRAVKESIEESLMMLEEKLDDDFRDLVKEELAENKEYAGLARQAQDIQELRPAVETLAAGIIAHIPLMEPRLEGLLTNYSVERLDYVDKAILYISLYELEVNGLDTPIVVSEATALANEFSGSKSAPFIHGIIAAAAASK